jgi:hypothetical protein
MAQDGAERVETEGDEELETTPWHFKLLLLAFVLYMAYRIVQLSVWGFHHLF